jgi:LysM repeat protein
VSRSIILNKKKTAKKLFYNLQLLNFTPKRFCFTPFNKFCNNHNYGTKIVVLRVSGTLSMSILFLQSLDPFIKTMTSKVIITLFIFNLFAHISWANGSFAVHSDTTKISSKPRNTTKYISHKVESGQTLYAVMRLYKTTIQALKAANPGMNESLKTGQIVRVPVSSGATSVAKTIPEPAKKQERVVVTFEEIPTSKPKEEAKPTPPAPKKETTAPVTVITEDKIIIKPAEEKTTTKPTEKVAEAKKEEPKKEEKPEPTLPPAKAGYHRVEPKQSLYSIAVKHGVLMADLRRWNNLSNDQLRAGQEIIISEQSYQDYLRKNKTDSVRLVDNRKTTPEKPTLPPPIEDNTNSNLPEPKITNLGKRTVELGIAEVIDVADAGNKYLALHRTAAVGSLVQVKNVNNSQSIWVKVIGKLPDIDVNKRIIIKLSARAYDKLAPTSRQFRAEISYLTE